MNYFISPATGKPMTNIERLQKFPSGRCPNCQSSQSWLGFFNSDLGRYDIQCGSCQLLFAVGA